METQALTIWGQDKFSREQIDLIKRQIAKGCTDDELMLFIIQAARTGLDPFSRQIYAIQRNEKDGDNYVKKMTIQISIDGLRLIAERSGRYAGQLGPLWCKKGGNWKDIWDEDGNPFAAKVGILKVGFKEPLWGIARWDSYAAYYKGVLSAMWQKYPDLMLAKCAESIALRKAFPLETSGLYTSEEMQQSDDPVMGEVTPPEQSIPAAPSAPPPGYVAPPESIHVPSKQNGNPAMPAELAKNLKIYAGRMYPLEKRTGPRGATIGKLDELAGDTMRRHTFTQALFGKESSSDLPDDVMMALGTWVTHPNAGAEVNRIINDYLKAQGQTELPIK